MNGRILTELPLLQLLLHKLYMAQPGLGTYPIGRWWNFSCMMQTETMINCFSTRLNGGVVYEIWDSQSSAVKDPNLLGYYVVSDGKQLLPFCTCIVPSSLESNSHARVFFCHLCALTALEEQGILIIWNHGNCLPVDMA